MSIISQEWLDKYPDLLARVTAQRKKTLRGYPAVPGTGPKGETCGTCGNCRLMAMYAKRFYKCACRSGGWTHGAGTDIKYRSPACVYFKVRWEREEKIL